jgi:hypothetical protein
MGVYTTALNGYNSRHIFNEYIIVSFISWEFRLHHQATFSRRWLYEMNFSITLLITMNFVHLVAGVYYYYHHHHYCY